MSDGNSIRVLRGGGWRIYPQNARVAHRLSVTPGYRNSSLGVRLVEDQTPASGSGRVVRGGSCYGGPRAARVADRDDFAPGVRSLILGIRLVEEVADA